MRQEARITQRQVAAELDWSPSKVLRIENGQNGISRSDLRAMLSLYGVGGEEAARLLDLSSGRLSRWSPYPWIHHELAGYLDYEESAGIIRHADNTLIPDLLQTEEYARAVLDLGRLEEYSRVDYIEERLGVLNQRQAALFGRDDVELFFVVDEAVVRRPPAAGQAGVEVMTEQLRQLQKLAADPQIHLQILRFNAGLHAGLRGPFIVLEFADPEDDQMLFQLYDRDRPLPRLDREEVGFYLDRFFTMEQMAMVPDAVPGFLDSVIRDLTD